MAKIVRRNYRIFVGPYRLALWSVSRKFKLALVANLVHNFEDNEQQRKLEKLRCVHEALERTCIEFELRKHAYQQKLAKDIDDLFSSGRIRVNGPRPNSEKCASARIKQIESYLQRLKMHWGRLRHETNFNRNDIFNAISELLWPYYGISYKLPSAQNYYTATWTTHTGLMDGVPFVSSPDRQSYLSNLKNELLYPSIATPKGVFDGNEDLRLLFDAASHADIDFEQPETTLGTVIESLHADAPFSVTPWVKITLEEPDKAQGSFLDLLYFINHGFRYVFSGKDVLSEKDTKYSELRDTQLGMLFVSTASDDALLCLANEDNGHSMEKLRAVISKSWLEIGGAQITKVCYEDLTDLIQELIPAVRSQERVTAYQSIGHALKTLVAGTGWKDTRKQIIRTRRQINQMVSDAATRAEVNAANRRSNKTESTVTPDNIIYSALDNAARSLTMFVLPESLGHFVRLAAAVRDEKWDKFQDWIDDSSSFCWTEENIGFVCESYRRSISSFVKCLSMAWPNKYSFVIKSLDNSSNPKSEQWTTDRDWNSVNSDFLGGLYFPPFVKGSYSQFIFLFALCEPVWNALDELSKLYADTTKLFQDRVLHDPNDPDLTLTIIPNLEEQKITIQIDNLSRKPVPEVIPGLSEVKKLLEGFFVDYNPSSAEQIGSLFRVSTQIQFTPFNLVRKLIEARRPALRGV
jgi:hypothetical protein